MTTKTTQMMNGVNIAQLMETIDAVRSDPSLARFQFRAEHRWLDGTHARSTVKGFYGAGREDDSREEAFELDHDEPPVILGMNRGVNPVEYAMSALAGCITTTFVVYASAKGIQLRSVTVSLEGALDLRGLLDLSPDVRPGYESIRVTYDIESDASREEIESLLSFAQAHSPVHDIVSNPVPVEVVLRNG